MAVMVLDHVRDFFTDARFDPTDLDETGPALFFTRWISHFCAPVFVFLAGTSAYLYGARGRTRGELARFLVVRGLWLILLELTAVRLGTAFTLDLARGWVQVIWAIGCSMIALSGLVFLPSWAVAVFGLAMIAGHNLLDGVRPEDLGRWGPLWVVLHQPGRVQLGPGISYFALYPMVPWIGVMAAGFAFGPILGLEPSRRRRVLLMLGTGLTSAFVLLRWANMYGDPQPWAAQQTPLFTLLSFLNCEKYPPSLLYLLMTLGPAIAALGLFDRGLGPVGRPLRTIGRVPLFFYLLQWPVAHLMAIAVAMIVGQPWRWLLRSGPFGGPEGYGHGLPFVYIMWVVALLILYPPCAWFADLKRRRRDAWLSYF
jgi:uncharacterized membrane protein